MTEKFDIDAAKKLANDIAANLSSLPGDDSRHAALRAEVEQLKAALARGGDASPEVEVKFKSVHSALDRAAIELQANGIRAGVFISEIGRLLGLD
jgi:hypothetical protein